MFIFHLIFVIVVLFNISNANTISNKYNLKEENNQPNSKENNGKLVAAHVIFRHGERNINKIYPNDPHQDESNFPEGIGQLTKNGKKQHYRLGQYFRKRYNQIIGKEYSRNDVYIQSTDMDRTLMSALANLAGLYMPTADEMFEENIRWHPIPVHTIPMKDDYVLLGPKNCPKFDVLYEKYVTESPEVQKMYEECEKLYEFLSEKSGMNISTIEGVFRFHDILYVEHLLNMTLSDWAYDVINPNGAVSKIVKFYFQMQSATPQMARLKMGFLVKEMLQHFTQKINSKLELNRSLWLYSAHDFTISNFLNSLGLFELHIPPFAASVHFELYKTDDDKHNIQIFYKTSEKELDLSPMYIPNCGYQCPLDQFYTVYNHIIPGDHHTECRPDETKAELDFNLEEIN